MPYDLTLIHTAAVHEATFEALADGARLRHLVYPDLLARAQSDGIEDVRAEFAALIAAQNGPVLCSCTTLGPLADAYGAIRIDRPLMAKAVAVAAGRPILMAYCLQSTYMPSLNLLRECAGPDAVIETLLLDTAWPLFVSGDMNLFAKSIADGVAQRLKQGGFGAVVLAQASMASAASLFNQQDVPVLASPELALRAALAVT